MKRLSPIIPFKVWIGELDELHWFRTNGFILYNIAFGWMFSSYIESNVLPQSLQILDLGQRFDQKMVKDLLPQNLHTLKLGIYFNKSIPVGIFPEFLHTLKFSCDFNRTLDVGVLPEKIGRASCRERV